MVRRGGRGRKIVLFRVPLIEVRHLQPGVERDDIPHVQLHAVGHRAIGDALEFGAVLGLDMRPEHVLGFLAEELPVLLFVVGHLDGDGLQGIVDLGSQQVAVLISDVGGAALQVYRDPAVLRGAAGGVFQAGIGLRLAGSQGEGQTHDKDGKDSGGSTHPVIIVKMHKLTAHVKAAG